jgi:hypothetical protein
LADDRIRQELYVRRDRLAAALHTDVPGGEVFASDSQGAEASAQAASQSTDRTNREAGPTTLAEMVPHLRLRRGMVLLDPSFSSLSSYISGFAMGSGELPHREFSWWLCDQYGLHRGPLVWESLVASHVGYVRRGWSSATVENDPAREAAACEELLDRVEQYLAADASVHEELRDAVDKKFAPRDPSIDS